MTQNIRYSVDSDGIAHLQIDVAGRPMNVLTPGFQADLAECIDKVAGRPSHQGRRGLIGQVELHGRRRHQGHGRRLRSRHHGSRGVGIQPLAAEAVPPHGDLRQAGGGRDQRRRARRRPRGHARLPLPRDRGRPEGGRGPARGDHRPAAGRRRHAARAAADRHPRGAAADHRGQAALRRRTRSRRGWCTRSRRLPRSSSAPGSGSSRAGRACSPGTRRASRSRAARARPRRPRRRPSWPARRSPRATTMRNYPAPLAILSCVYEGTQVPIDQGLRIESKYFGKLLAGPVARNLMRTMFVNKGLADKLARRPAGPPKSQVRRLGILGAGMMGAGVAYVSALAGMDVVLLDSTLELAEKGKDYSRQLLAKDVSRGKRSQADADADARPHHAHGELRRPRRRRPRDRGGVREPRHQGRRDGESRGRDPEECGVREQHLDAADHRPRAGLEAPGAVHRHPLLLAGGQDAARRDHPRQEDQRGHARPRARLRRAAAQDADRRERQPRLLYEPLLRHLRLRGHGDAAGGRQSGADRERGEAGRHAGRARSPSPTR